MLNVSTRALVSLPIGGSIFLFGLVGNIWVIALFSCVRSLWRPSNIFLVNLAVIDSLMLVYISPIPAINYILQLEEYYMTNHTPCKIQGVALGINFFISVSAMAIIAFNRYISIANHALAQKYFTTKSCIVAVACIWIYNALIFCPILFGWGKVEFVDPLVICLPSSTYSLSYNWFVLILAFILPSLVTAMSYVGIFLRVKKSKKRIQSHNQSNSTIPTKGELRFATQMFIIMSIFYATWGPFLYVRNVEGVAKSVLVGVSSALSFNAIVNPMIYLYFNQKFREKSLQYIRCRGHRQNPNGQSVQTANSK